MHSNNSKKIIALDYRTSDPSAVDDGVGSSVTMVGDGHEPKLEVGEAPRDPEEAEARADGGPTEISAATTLGAVSLTVAELERSVTYYEQAVGLKVLERAEQRASLGTDGHELLQLVEERGARPAAGYTGLYHFALLVPERADLARWLAHAARERQPIVGLSDHFVSEAIYLSDPDGHGIEIYWDRPRELWEGLVGERLTTLPLDVDSLLGELDDPAAEPFDALATGTVMGHVHLKVATIPDAISFYRDRLGFGLMAQLGSQAAFLGAGGYHHHIGANTWESSGASPAPAGTAALRQATIVLPDIAERDRLIARLKDSDRVSEEEGNPIVVDPSGNRLLILVA
jgi:catechol 2,3-dioxygenase